MNRPWKLLGSGSITLALITILAVGCEQSRPLSAQNPAESSVPVQQPSNAPAPNGPVVSFNPPSTEPTAAPEVGLDHKAHVSAVNPTNNGTSAALSTEGSAKQASKPSIEAKDAYQQEKPTLMGFKLGTTKDTVLSRFGKANNQFVMDDDTDPINVYEYADFSVGFNTRNELTFVDVRTGDIDPGLRGLRLGQKPEDAIAILGKPDTNTTYVLSYKTQGVILKLDIDPKQNTIQSIKLFANQ
jgi:hypothetical protein